MQTFKNPATPVSDRLDEIAAMARDWEPVEHAWPESADVAWLRAALAENWSLSFPQPYVGTGPEDAMVSLYWKTSHETVTLEIETASRTGYLCRSPNQDIGEVELAVDMDLSSSEAWRQIASELGVEVGRSGDVLVAGLGQPVSGRGNTGSGIST